MSKQNKDRNEEEAPHVSRSFVPLTATIVSAYVAHNQVPQGELQGFVARLHAAFAEIGGLADRAPSPKPIKPAVAIRKSVGDTFLICLEDGKKVTMLKRYLRRKYNLSPEQYRAKWGLPGDYPMVAPSYARLRSAFAKKIGLGGKRSRRPKKS